MRSIRNCGMPKTPRVKILSADNIDNIATPRTRRVCSLEINENFPSNFSSFIAPNSIVFPSSTPPTDISDPSSDIAIPSVVSSSVSSDNSIIAPSKHITQQLKSISLKVLPPSITPRYVALPIEMQACRFVKLLDLVRVIDRARASSFAVHAVRMETHNLISNLRSFYIDIDHRFPEMPRVNLTVGTVADLVAKLLAALDFGEHTPMDNVNNRSTYSDKHLAYLKTCEAILNHLVNITTNVSVIRGIFDRCTFESTYSLTWEN